MGYKLMMFRNELEVGPIKINPDALDERSGDSRRSVVETVNKLDIRLDENGVVSSNIDGCSIRSHVIEFNNSKFDPETKQIVHAKVKYDAIQIKPYRAIRANMGYYSAINWIAISSHAVWVNLDTRSGANRNELDLSEEN